MENNWLLKLLTFLVVAVLVNLFVLDFTLLKKSNGISPQSVEVGTRVKPLNMPVSSPSLSSTPPPFDPTNILTVIKEATATLTQRIAVIEALPIKNTNPQPAPAPKKTAVSREYYIPLGSSSSQSTAWFEINGVEAYVAPSNYGKITSMYFEASLVIPSGNGQAWARLKNITDTNSLIESEVWIEGSTGKLVSSGKIPVPTSTKLYRVELRSTLGAEVKLENARIKLFAE